MKHFLLVCLAWVLAAGTARMHAQAATLDVELVSTSAFGKTYRLYAHLPFATDELISVFGYINPTTSDRKSVV